MVKELGYEAVEVGEEFGPMEHPLDDAAMDKYLKGSGNNNPWHRETSPYGPAIAPPAMLGNLTLRLMDTKYYLPLGTLHAKQELDFLNPVRLDRKLISRGKIADKYVRRGREWIIFDAEFSDDEGTQIAKSRVVLAMPLSDAARGEEGERS